MFSMTCQPSALSRCLARLVPWPVNRSSARALGASRLRAAVLPLKALATTLVHDTASTGITATVGALYLWPIVRYFRGGAAEPAPPLVQRRTVNAPLAMALIGFTPWLASAVLFPSLTLARFGRWPVDLMSQQVLSPLVNGFLAATTTYLLLDWLFRRLVAPHVFPAGRLRPV